MNPQTLIPLTSNLVKYSYILTSSCKLQLGHEAQ